jgi:hypothetical protein
MNTIIKTWFTWGTTAKFTSHSRHSMDELFVGANIFSERSLRKSIQSLVPAPIIIKAESLQRAAAATSATSTVNSAPEIVITADDAPDELPTPTDVPVPEPWDVPAPEPVDVPPPTPHDVPPPDFTDPEPDHQARPIL